MEESAEDHFEEGFEVQGRRQLPGLLRAAQARQNRGTPRSEEAVEDARPQLLVLLGLGDRNPQTRLPWPNSTLLDGDLATSVAALKQNSPGDVVVMGSGELIAALMSVHAIDIFVLMIHPLVLGGGRHPFTADGYAPLHLVESRTTTKGVLLATHEPMP